MSVTETNSADASNADGKLEEEDVVNNTSVQEPLQGTASWWKIANLTIFTKLVCDKQPAVLLKKNFFPRSGTPHSLRGVSQGYNCTRLTYTFCHQFFRLYQYRLRTNSCVSTQMDPAMICNRSPDRFSSMAECRRICTHPRKKPEVCGSGPLFSECSSHDVKTTWTYFDGTSCKPWPFHDGLCPAPGNKRVFSSRHNCHRKCMTPRKRAYGSRITCQAGMGDAVTCPTDVLRFPYFATYLDGEFNCFRASIELLSNHHCLLSRALFSNREDCRKECVQVPTPKDICLRM
ncbi:hypothetical protein HPB51_023169 [Rhipicephalus microplus]|uniref:Uncharacterized protein n=1 Tax=Rhipicephalus microplus TaxID=6941 RepID=A0A9J6DJM0_RHIMP|nr:hypothetical protein HPB51_023169 [Rhipicephalus microplus]